MTPRSHLRACRGSTCEAAWAGLDSDRLPIRPWIGSLSLWAEFEIQFPSDQAAEPGAEVDIALRSEPLEGDGGARG